MPPLARRCLLFLPARAVLASALLPPLPASAQQRGGRPQGGGRHGGAPQARGPPAAPATTPLGPLDTGAKQAIVFDYDTDAVLLEKNADVRMPPSSMSKLMTMYMVFDRLKQGRLKPDQELPVSERAWRMGGSKMFVQGGATVPVEALMRGVIVQSGNDACVVLAEVYRLDMLFMRGREDRLRARIKGYQAAFALCADTRSVCDALLAELDDAERGPM